MSNKTAKELLKEAWYLGIKGFSRLKKYELEKDIRDANTKETNTGHETCDTCCSEQYKLRLIDEPLYTRKLLDAAIRKLSLLCENCRNDCVVTDRDAKVCGNFGTLQSDL